MKTDFDYHITRTKRRRSLSISVSEDNRVEVRVPYAVMQAEVERFIGQKRRWVNKCLTDNKRKHAQFPPKCFATGDRFFYLGSGYRLVVEHSLFSDVVVHKKNMQVFLPLGSDDQAQSAKQMLHDWYIQKAQKFIPERVQHYAEQLHVQPAQVRVQAFKSQWGSCSPHNHLSFDWTLVMAPQAVLDSVVVHELCHLIHRNHSRHFWDRVTSIMPDYDDQHAWLKAHQVELKGVSRQLSH